jgi:hypothetical protein
LVAPVHKNLIPIYVRNKVTHALVDSGANISAINEKFLYRLGLNSCHYKPSNIAHIVGAGGENHKITGLVQLKLKIGGLYFSHSFYVVPALHNSVILGIDFLTKYKAIVNLDTQTLSLLDDTVTINLIHNETGLARTNTVSTIFPNSISTIAVCISKIPKGTSVLLEPCYSLSKSAILPGRTILTVSKKNYIQIINPTPVPMHIPPNTVLACVDVLHPQTICTINEDTIDKKKLT